MSEPSEPVMLHSIEEMEAKLGEGIWAIGFQPRLTFQPNDVTSIYVATSFRRNSIGQTSFGWHIMVTSVHRNVKTVMLLSIEEMEAKLG